MIYIPHCVYVCVCVCVLYSHHLLMAICRPVEPRRHFEIVFKMIDIDGNDTIDIEEFDMVTLTLFATTNILIIYTKYGNLVGQSKISILALSPKP